MRQPLALLFFFFLTTQLTAQVKLTPHFEALLGQAGLEFITPVEARYRPARTARAPFQQYDFAMRSRLEKLEVRYIVKPYDATSPLDELPQLSAFRLVTHLATNEEDYVISERELSPDVLAQDFNADWGRQYFFHPKPHFADARHCELLALHKAGRGTAFVLFLFDEPSRELGNRFYALRFEEDRPRKQ
ncbi:MAG: hypothetical protein KDC66_10095 [Phaeodactylibacter sp.]|nr:hypothetical protein [Phaeodactylibacter sp.]MCB9276339.1 hypothetical protein [Lewinellaceae bacterium]